MNALPTNWRVAALETLLAPEHRSITDGPFGSNLTSAHYTDAGPRVIRLGNIGDGVFIDSPAHISQEHFNRLRMHEARAGDLVIASLGEALPRACLVPDALGPAMVKADCIRVRLGPEVEPRWVLYAMQSPAVRRWAETHRHGVGRPRLGLKAIRQIPLPVPPLDEQRQIVDILEDHLSRLDAAVAWHASAFRKLPPLVKSVLRDLVPSEAPRDWRLLTVGEVGRVDLGRQRHPNWHTGPEMRPYLRVANVFEDRIDTRDVMEMDFSGAFERFRLSPGDVLLNEGQSPEWLGRPAIYRGDPPNVAYTNSLIRFRAGADVLPEWALLVFRRHMHLGRFQRESRITTNIAHLSAGRLKSVEFPVPPIAAQERLVAAARERLDAIDRFRRQLDESRVRVKALRRALLDAAFSGRLMGTPSDTDHTDHVEELAGV